MTFYRLNFPRLVLCNKILGYMVREFNGVVFRTVVVPSVGIFYGVRRSYVSYGFINHVLSCVTFKLIARDRVHVLLPVVFTRVFAYASATVVC